jgi:2-keto-4-pentenoate hydratase/2-oxohepta-3-ene-1,7-dioic acid hydratase in catechol pathway
VGRRGAIYKVLEFLKAVIKNKNGGKIMKLVRFQKDGKISYGVLEENIIKVINGDIFDKFTVTDNVYTLNEVTLKAPCTPSKIVCVGLNYRDHAEEMKDRIPEEPVLFIKPSTAVIGPKESIIYPKMSNQVDYEAELAVVIKDKIKDIEEDHVKEHILGYTCFNDVTARDLQKKDGQWTRAKSFDTFAPFGPTIVTGVDPSNLNIQLLLNDQIKQNSNTNQLIFSVEKLVSFISKIMTLNPGDVIATGTPSGVEPMNVGDKVAVKIEKIGILENNVRN